MVVIASYLGERKHPAWWLNLSTTPDATVQVGTRDFRVRARETSGDERESLWKDVVAVNADYAEYATRTDRLIPVVVLEPVA